MNTRAFALHLLALGLLTQAPAQTPDPAAANPAPAAAAATIAGAVPTENTATRDRDLISVDFPDEDIKTILRNVADLFELNLVVPDTLTGKTSIKLRDVTWRQIFQVVLAPAGYTYVEETNIIKVVSNDSLLAEPVSTEVFILNNAKAADIKPTVDGLVDPAAGGKILIDARSNALIVTERPSRMTRMRAIIEQLDKATDQVMIESKFVEVTDRDIRNIGVNWASLQGVQLSAGGLTQTFNRSRGQTTNNGSNTSNTTNSANTNSNTTNSGSNNSTNNTTTTGTNSSSSNTTTNGTVNDSTTGLNNSVVTTGTVFQPMLTSVSTTTTGTQLTQQTTTTIDPVTNQPVTTTTLVTVPTDTQSTTTTNTAGTTSGSTLTTNNSTTGSNTGTSSSTNLSNINGTNAATNNLANAATNFGEALSNTVTSGANNVVNSLTGLTNLGSTNRLTSAVFSVSDFNIILSALKQQNNTKVISNPTIVTLNNSEAILNIGSEFPIPSYTYNSERGAFEVSGFTYKPIGINLKVTPQVNAQGLIKLKLEPEVSQQSGTTSFGGAGGANIPVIATRKVQTQVSLKDGYTAGIGGLLQAQKDHGGTKVPILGDIPGLGRLFSSKTVNDTTTNLLIFVTAKTVSADGGTATEIFGADAVAAAGLTPEVTPVPDPKARKKKR